ncbi:MAG: hypothetical protein E7312_06065 [Clostridiales bacterium]|nr:hypothetical protein [Clostridiales bacterium]
MSKLKRISNLFFTLSSMLFGAMIASVTHSYFSNLHAIEYHYTSAPAEIAFLLIIPYAVAIALCLGIGYVLRRKASK